MWLVREDSSVAGCDLRLFNSLEGPTETVPSGQRNRDERRTASYGLCLCSVPETTPCSTPIMMVEIVHRVVARWQKRNLHPCKERRQSHHRNPSLSFRSGEKSGTTKCAKNANEIISSGSSARVTRKNSTW